MTGEERERFLPATRTFVSVLEKPNLDQREIDQLIKESEALSVLIPESMREVISSSLSNLISARSGWKLSYIYTILHWYDINAYINYTSCHTINNIKTNIPMKIWLFFYYSKNSFVQLLYLLVPIITSQKKFCFYSRNKNWKGTSVFRINRSTHLLIMKKISYQHSFITYRVFRPDLIYFEELGGQLKTAFGSKWRYLRCRQLSFINWFKKEINIGTQNDQ